jgi:glutamate-1-semialdehyde 2,1-aminomutase
MYNQARSMGDLHEIRAILNASQQRTFPRKMREFGLDLILRRGVFPPDEFQSWRWICENFPPFAGKTILEIGCGFGLPGLFLAKAGALTVVACDINPVAVENTLENAARNEIHNIEVIVSDIFSNIADGKKFDIVFWNYPSNYVAENYNAINELECGAFDPGYNLLRRFLSQGPEFLSENGFILLGFGTNGRDDLLAQITAANKLTSVMLGFGTCPPANVTYRLFSIFAKKVTRA